MAAIRHLYLERAVAEHPRARSILARFPGATVIPCERYGEVFNRRGQSFRLQKRRPGLILAEKRGRRVLPAPPGYGVGGGRSFYFSHMWNCPYDCRYCFLQGMYRSAHYLVFVNYEDFERDIDAALAEAPGEESWFFSGYDCDSLAFDGVTGFTGHFLPFFAGRPAARLELRTKSVRFAPLLAREPLPNAVVAVSLTPEEVARSLEHGAPPVRRRLAALEPLAGAGWRLGLRFDPLIWYPDFRRGYRRLFEDVFDRLPPESLHSVSLGAFRLPASFHRNLTRLYPDEPLFAGPLAERGGMVSYRPALEQELVGFCTEELRAHIPEEIFFPCLDTTPAAAA